MPKYSTNGDCSFKFELPRALRDKFVRYAKLTNRGSASELMRRMVHEFCEEWERRQTGVCYHPHVKCLDCWEPAGDIGWTPPKVPQPVDCTMTPGCTHCLTRDASA